MRTSLLKHEKGVESVTLEGYVDSNPALLLEPPRLGLHLPEVLSVEENYLDLWQKLNA